MFETLSSSVFLFEAFAPLTTDAYVTVD